MTLFSKKTGRGPGHKQQIGAVALIQDRNDGDLVRRGSSGHGKMEFTSDFTLKVWLTEFANGVDAGVREREDSRMTHTKALGLIKSKELPVTEMRKSADRVWLLTCLTSK